MRNRAKIWIATGVVLAVAGIAGFVGLFSAEPDSSQSPLAELAPAERNLAIFDAACALIERNFYEREALKSQAWEDYKALWREGARRVEPSLLYMNVLNNFAAGFPRSHLGFEAPKLAPAQSPAPVPAPVANPKNKQQKPAMDVEKTMELVLSGPGFEAATIRRDGVTPSIVADLYANSPAERAGISPGWMIVSSNWTADHGGVAFSARLLPLDEAGVRALDETGLPPGVSAWDQREAYLEAHALNFDFAMEKLPRRPNFEVRTLGGITYLRFDGFDDAALADKALDAIDSAGPAGLIIDLRRNPGGRGLHLMRVLGRLLGSVVVVGYTRSAGEGKVEMKSLNLGTQYQGPVALLIGPATSSAAEITAAAIQDLKRGKLIGRRTNGSVLSANKFDLPDGGKIMIPVKDFLRLNDGRVEGAGVQPDIWLLPTLQDVRLGRDPLVDRALAVLRSTRARSATSN